MDITFDPEKDKRNIAERQLPFERAKDFDFKTALFEIDNRRDYGEVRYRALGLLDQRLHALIFVETERGIRVIGFTKTNHSNTALCFDKYKGVQTLIEQPKRPIAYFTVVTPVIDFKKSGFEIEILGPFKRQLALCNVAFVLFGVKGN